MPHASNDAGPAGSGSSARWRRAAGVDLWSITVAVLTLVLALFVSVGSFIVQGEPPERWGDGLAWLLWAILVIGWVPVAATALVGLPVALGRRLSGRRLIGGLTVTGLAGVGWVVTAWMIRQGGFGLDRGRVVPVVVALEVLLGLALVGRWLCWLLAVRLRKRLRLRRRAGRIGALSALPILVGPASAAVLLLVGARAPSPPVGADLRQAERPARRVVMWAVDGVDRSQLAYWIAVNGNAPLSRLALGGASAYMSWQADQPRLAWSGLLAGVGPLALPGTTRDRGADGVVDRPVTYRRVLASALGLDPAGGVGMNVGTAPSIWDVCGRAGLRADVVGWWTDPGPTTPGVRLVGRSVYPLVRGEPGRSAPASGLPPELAARLRDWARLPWEDWRRGALMSPGEAATVERCAELGLDPEGLWRDRFFLRAALELQRLGESDLVSVYLSYPKEITASESAASDEVDRAVRAYLDFLDERVAEAVSSLRAGEVLALVFTPPPVTWGPAADAPGTATVLLFGEKIAPVSAEGETVAPADVARTVLYLLGIRGSRETGGQVAWNLLVPGTDVNFPPGYVSAYGPRTSLASTMGSGTREPDTPERGSD